MSDDYRPHPEFDVLRDNTGAPITITPLHCANRTVWTSQQFAAFLHAWSVRAELVRRHRPEYAERWNDLTNTANFQKSRLMGRMLYDGLPPLTDPPPSDLMGGPDYSAADAPEDTPTSGGSDG